MKLTKTLKESFLDFCLGSSIAGLQHAGDPTRSALYRTCWSIIIGLAFALAGVMLWNSVKGIFVKSKIPSGQFFPLHSSTALVSSSMTLIGLTNLT